LSSDGSGFSTQRRGLGRGLEALIGPLPATPTVAELPVEAIHPNPRQPRRRFDAEAAAGLAESIRAEGLLQPVVVRPRPQGGYELIVGERRWRAARAAGAPTLPALVRDADDRDSLLLALVENVAREQLSPVEEARAYAVLLDEFGLSLGEVASRVGRSKPAVSNRVRLLDLPDDVLALVDRGELSEGHARAVLALSDHGDRRSLARRIVAQGLSVRAAERAAREGGARRRRRGSPAGIDPALASRARAAAERLTGLPAAVRPGRLEIAFADEAQLEELVESLERAGARPGEQPRSFRPAAVR
jgi:ParB family chromosome partitioning protein